MEHAEYLCSMRTGAVNMSFVGLDVGSGKGSVQVGTGW
jgi:hypothetical protein